MTRVAVVVPIRPDSVESARLLVQQGAPFALEDTPLDAHSVYVTDAEAVFVFEGPDAREVVEHLVGEVNVWEAAAAWRPLLAARPRVAEPVFAWHRR